MSSSQEEGGAPKPRVHRYGGKDGFDVLPPSVAKFVDGTAREVRGKLNPNHFYGEYHGHPVDMLETAHAVLRHQGEKRRRVAWFVGDSSLDNKCTFVGLRGRRSCVSTELTLPPLQTGSVMGLARTASTALRKYFRGNSSAWYRTLRTGESCLAWSGSPLVSFRLFSSRLVSSFLLSSLLFSSKIAS